MSTEKHFLFAYDNLILGMPRSIEFLKGETYHGPALLKGNYAMFYSGNVFLTQWPSERHIHGDLFEISDVTLAKLDEKYGFSSSKPKYKFERKEITVLIREGENNIEKKCFAYIFPLDQLRRYQFKTILIDSYRDMSPALRNSTHAPKICC